MLLGCLGIFPNPLALDQPGGKGPPVSVSEPSNPYACGYVAIHAGGDAAAAASIASKAAFTSALVAVPGGLDFDSANPSGSGPQHGLSRLRVGGGAAASDDDGGGGGGVGPCGGSGDVGPCGAGDSAGAGGDGGSAGAGGAGGAGGAAGTAGVVIPFTTTCIFLLSSSPNKCSTFLYFLFDLGFFKIKGIPNKKTINKIIRKLIKVNFI